MEQPGVPFGEINGASSSFGARIAPWTVSRLLAARPLLRAGTSVLNKQLVQLRFLLSATREELLVTRQTGAVFGIFNAYDADDMGGAFWRNAHSTIAQCPE